MCACVCCCVCTRVCVWLRMRERVTARAFVCLRVRACMVVIAFARVCTCFFGCVRFKYVGGCLRARVCMWSLSCVCVLWLRSRVCERGIVVAFERACVVIQGNRGFAEATSSLDRFCVMLSDVGEVGGGTRCQMRTGQLGHSAGFVKAVLLCRCVCCSCGMRSHRLALN